MDPEKVEMKFMNVTFYLEKKVRTHKQVTNDLLCNHRKETFSIQIFDNKNGEFPTWLSKQKEEPIVFYTNQLLQNGFG